MTVRPQKYRMTPVDAVVEHPDNPNVGADDAILGSLEELGFYGACLVQESTSRILAGHSRWRAAKRNGETKLPMIWIECDDVEARKIMAGDNQYARLATMDHDKLVALLEGFDGDLSGTGFTEGDLLELLGGQKKPFGDPDAAPARPENPYSRLGDLWICGPHRVLCASSSAPGSITRVLDGGRADIVWTDPPYGVSYTAGGSRKAIANDDLGVPELEVLLRSVFRQAAEACWPGACWYVCAPPGPAFLAFATVLAEMKIWRQTLAWVKDSLVLGRADYHGRHEAIVYGELDGGAPPRPAPIAVPEELLAGDAYDEAAEALMYGWNPGAAHQRPPNRKQDSVWMVARPKASELHPTMKPVGLIERALRNSSRLGHVVLDPFAGSGSTLVGAHQCGRVARVVELDPGYVDVICRRWQDGSGVLPVLEADGTPHDFTREASRGQARTEADADAASPRARRDPPVAGEPSRAEAAARPVTGGARRRARR